jgi:hypothetical protein
LSQVIEVELDVLHSQETAFLWINN